MYNPMTIFDKGLLLYFFVLFILWLWYFNTEGDRKPDKRHDLSNVNSERSNWAKIFKSAKYLPAVNKKEFINAVVSWGIKNLSYEGLSEKRNYEKNYYKLLKEKTYSYHPMEIEAEAIAAAYTNDCKKYLVEKGILRIKNKKN